ncbi:MAG: glycosyltransferase family 4 protein [Chitinophagaceae bacterium]
MIYIPNLSQDSGGIKQYSMGLLNVLAGDTQHTYFINHNTGDKDIISLINRNKQFIHIKEEISKWENYTSYTKRVYNFLCRALLIKKQIRISNSLEGICNKYGIKVIHCPYQRLPEVSNVQLITTLHDVQELHLPAFFSPAERAFRANCYMDILNRADKIIVSYEHVKNDLISFFNTPNHKIHIILLEMERLWFEKFSEKDSISFSDINVPQKFLLYPANTWKHKNHIRLLKAVALLRDKYNLSVFVICSGHTNDHFNNDIQILIADLNLESQVKFLGIVEEHVLFSLYKNAAGVVIPTLYEAGSFPLMESILLEIPVICSNVTSLPDTIQNEDYTFDPYNINDIADKIKSLWVSDIYRNKSIQNSKKVGRNLKGTNALQNLQKLYRELDKNVSGSA